MPPEKTMVLACSFEGPWLERFLAKQGGYSVVRCKSGAAALSTVLEKEPDVLLIHGFFLEDIDGYDLIDKIEKALPDCKMRFIFMTNARFDDEADIRWGFGGIDVVLPKNTPSEFLIPILEKMKEPKNEGNT